MHDQVMNLKEYGVEAVFLNSSQNYGETQKAKAKILNGTVKIIYVSPEGILSGALAGFLIKSMFHLSLSMKLTVCLNGGMSLEKTIHA